MLCLRREQYVMKMYKIAQMKQVAAWVLEEICQKKNRLI